jgi:hypothetical protein
MQSPLRILYQRSILPLTEMMRGHAGELFAGSLDSGCHIDFRYFIADNGCNVEDAAHEVKPAMFRAKSMCQCSCGWSGCTKPAPFLVGVGDCSAKSPRY